MIGGPLEVVVVLLVFGLLFAHKLPALAGAAGAAIAELRPH